MNKELQDLVWKHCLPKEFKEEVKKYYDNSTALGATVVLLLENLFGVHNLTSDAEGEVELLHVTRQKVMGLYANAKKIHDLYTSATCINAKESQQIDISKGVMSVLETLFGSKCLPDNVATYEPNVEGLGDNVESSEPKPAEPKYHRGEKVRYNGYVYEVEGLVGKNRYALKGLNFDLDEDMIEPCTVPRKNDSEILHAESVKETRIADEETHLRNLSQGTANCDKHFDNILKDSFSKERRLNIAAMIMGSIIQSGLYSLAEQYRKINIPEMAKLSTQITDALIEVQKGECK